ncbi:MAG TPA: Hsp70 family protein [Polyangiaceae bacterium]
MAWLVARFEADSGVDVRSDETAMKRIREAAARITTLTEMDEVNLPFLAADGAGPKHFQVLLRKRQIERILSGEELPPPTPPRVTPPRVETPEPEEKRDSPWLAIALTLLLFSIAGSIVYACTRQSRVEVIPYEHGTEHKH